MLHPTCEQVQDIGWLTLTLTPIRCRTSVGSSWRTTAASTRCGGCSRSGSSSCSSCSVPTRSRPIGSRHGAPHGAPHVHRMCTACAPHAHAHCTHTVCALHAYFLSAVGAEPPHRRTAVAAGGAARDGGSSRRAADARFLLQATPRGARPLRAPSVPGVPTAGRVGNELTSSPFAAHTPRLVVAGGVRELTAVSPSCPPHTGWRTPPHNVEWRGVSTRVLIYVFTASDAFIFPVAGR